MAFLRYGGGSAYRSSYCYSGRLTDIFRIMKAFKILILLEKLNNRYITKNAVVVLLKDFIGSKIFCRGRIMYCVMSITAGTIYYRESVNLSLPWYVNDYFNDLLCMPLVLGLLSFTIRYLKNDSSFHFSIFFIIGLALYYSLYFEYYLPEVNSRYTSDWIDILLYFLGGVLFYAYHRTSPDKLE